MLADEGGLLRGLGLAQGSREVPRASTRPHDVTGRAWPRERRLRSVRARGPAAAWVVRGGAPAWRAPRGLVRGRVASVSVASEGAGLRPCVCGGPLPGE